VNWGENGSHKSRKGRWSQAEIARLRDMYGLRDERSIARELRRSTASVRRMAESLFRKADRSGPWSAEEVRSLKRYLGATTSEVIARILGRRESEIREKVMELGRIQGRADWSREETLHLKRIYGTRSDDDLAAIFGRDVEVVRKYADKLCLAKDKAFLKKVNGKGATRMPRWSQAELRLLRDLYPVTSNLEIAKQLNRSVKSIVSKAHHVGLKKDVERLREMGRQNVSLRYNSKE